MRILARCLSTLLIYFVFVPNAFAASFDCNKATTKIEVAICNDPELSKLDEILAKKYHELSDPSMTDEQLLWLSKRDTCETEECLKETMLNRVGQFDAILDGKSEADLRFRCKIPPIEFRVYSQGGAYGDWSVVVDEKFGLKREFELTWDTHGSGECRHWDYISDNDGTSFSLSSLSKCGGPDSQPIPQNVIGELSFADISLFCFDPLK